MFYAPAVPLSYFGQQTRSYECSPLTPDHQKAGQIAKFCFRARQMQIECRFCIRYLGEITSGLLTFEHWCTWLEVCKQTGLHPTRVQGAACVADTQQHTLIVVACRALQAAFDVMFEPDGDCYTCSWPSPV